VMPVLSQSSELDSAISNNGTKGKGGQGDGTRWGQCLG
jgi:hypothetical protein